MNSIASHSIHSHSNAEEGGLNLSIDQKPKKGRSKVWEKVVWFTRKTKTAKDSKTSSLQETQKGSVSPCFKRRELKKLDSGLVELRESSLTCQTPSSRNTPCSTSPNLVKAKSRSGIRKARSFNYLKRRKPTSHNENTSVDKSSLNGNEAPSEMATGTFCDFGESTRRRTSRVSESCSNLLNEMTREVSFKQRTNRKANTKRSLSLPMSLLSIGENMISELDETGSGSQPLEPTRQGSMYNSWPRKKRQFRSNHYSEALSPPQKQKRLTNLRKTATFNGFDKLNANEDIMKKNDYIKSSSLPDSEDSQIKNQNGLEIGVIHFFKSSSSSNRVPVVHAGRNDSDGNSSQDDSDDKELLMIDALSRLGELVVTKDLENKPLQLLLPELPHPGNELDGHTNGIIEHTTSGLPDSLDSIKQARSLECGTVLNCSTEHAPDTCQLKPHIADKVNPNLHLSSQVQYSKPDQQLEVICEVFDDAVEDDDDKLNNSQIAMETVKGGGNCHSMSMTETSRQFELSNCHLVENSSPPHECPIINESSFTESCLQSIKNLPQRNMNLDSLNCFGKDNKSTQYVKLQSNNLINDSCSANKKFSLDANVYCVKIEDQTTDFWRKNEKDEQEIKLMPQTITEHVIGKDNLLSNKSSEEGLSNLNNSLAFKTNAFKILNSPDSKRGNVEDIGNNVELSSQIDRNEYNELDLQDSYHGDLPSKILMKGQTVNNVSGQQFKQKTENMMEWFSDFNNEQKNIFLRRLLEKCGLPQMHMLSVIMEPALHKTCPSNCQDMLVWLPHPATERVMSYLDPVSLCRCSQVNKFWNNLAGHPLNWKRLCRSSDWQLSRNAAKNQSDKYTLPCGIIQWKKMFAERFLLRRKWLNGSCRVRTFEGHTQGISCVQFDDTRIVSGSSDKTIKVWDLSLNDSHAVLTLAGHSGTVRCLNLNGNRLVSGSVDKSIKVWDLSFESYWSGASCKVTMVGHVHTVRCLQVDDQKVVSGSYDKTLKVWDIKTGNCKLTLRGHNAAVLCVQFDETKIVSGSYDNTIKVWSLQEGECLMTLTGHHDAVTCLNLTQDCRKVISGSLDHNLKFWDLASGKCIGTLDWIRSEGHTGVIRCLQSDSWRIVSAGDDKTLKMWSLETGQRLLTLRCHTDGVTCLQFNDYMIVSGSYDKTVKVWSFVPEHEFLNPS